MKSYFTTLALMAAMAPFVHGVTTFTFDGATPATTSGTALPAGVTLVNAYYETVDANGDPLTTNGFRADPVTPTVMVGDPGPAGYGAAIAGNALDGSQGPIMFTFASALNLSNFGVFLDNSTLGNIPVTGGDPAGGTNILFYDSMDTLIGFIPVDERVSGFTVANGSTFNNISKFILPSGAFYDNMSFTAAAVPEPTSAALACLGAFALFKRRRV